MSDTFQQRVLVRTAIEALPPVLVNELANDKTFVERWAIPVETNIGIAEGGPIFELGHLYQRIRAAIQKEDSPVTLVDTEEVAWTLVAENREGRLMFTIESNGRKITIQDYSALAHDPAIRVAWLERIARDASIERAVVEKWRRRIERDPLDDEEFSKLTLDFAITPTSIYRNILNTLASGSVSIGTLVPTDKTYYHRLTGSVASDTAVDEFVESGIGPLMERLRDGNPIQGILSSLLTCSAGNVSSNVRIDTMEKGDLLEVYKWLVESGDPLSQIGSVEMALSHLGRYPELEPYVGELLAAILEDDPEDDNGVFALLSAVMILVSSELTRTKTLGRVPPYYRRQVAICHASLIIRAIIAAGVYRNSVTEWARAVGTAQNYYFLQGLIDQRLEPRWLPDFGSAKQLRAEFLGRVVNSVRQHREQIEASSLRELLVGGDSALERATNSQLTMLAGVLEGGIAPNRRIADDQLEEMKSCLRDETLEPSSFSGLIGAALVCDLPAEIGQLAAEAISRVRYSIEDGGDWEEMLTVFRGLAVVASVTRNTDLSGALRIMVRLQRRMGRFGNDGQQEFVIAMMSAASYQEREEWARFAGEWITECAFEIEDRRCAVESRAMLLQLIQIEPALARHCAAADAALACVTR